MLSKLIVAAFNAATPLVAVTSADQNAAVGEIARATDGRPKILWDCVRGLKGINEKGTAVLANLLNDETDTANPQTALEVAHQLPGAPNDEEDGAVLFMLNAHRFIEDPFFSTGLLNLREPFKSTRRAVILLGPSFTLPAELQQDVIIIDDPLPNDEALATRLRSLWEGNGITFDDNILTRATDAVRGLSLFGTEQVASMCVKEESDDSFAVDDEALWDRKRSQLNQNKGVTLLKGGPTLDDVQGYISITRYLRLLADGEDPFRVVVWIDELEKFFSGLKNPADSTTSDQLGTILRWTEEKKHDGCIFVGPPGTGKSFAAQAAGSTFGRPTVMLDLGDLKGSLVGQSEANIRNALKVIDGIAAGRALILATCNKLDALPPELRRRFLNGIWYFDLPTEAERDAIWGYQATAHGLTIESPKDRPADDGWTGAEIRNCCRIASRLRISLKEAAGYIVPVKTADPASIKGLQSLAHGRFLSASDPGPYRKPGSKVGETTRKLRTTSKAN